jgi:hypothetical protein
VVSFGCGSRRSADGPIPSASSNRAAQHVVFVLLALTTVNRQTKALSVRHVQVSDIEGLDRKPCPFPCLGEREKGVWTLVHSLNILGASSRGLVTCALLHLTTPAPRYRAEQIREFRGSPLFFLLLTAVVGTFLSCFPDQFKFGS